MNLFKIAWRNAQQRGLSTLLTTISLALGVGLVVLVLSIHGIVSDAFQRNATVGYNLVVGAKGSPLQLTLNTVYYLSQPVENLPYDYYLEFFGQEERERQLAAYGGHLDEPDRPGKFSLYTGSDSGGLVIPVCLGDYFGEYRVVGTTPAFLDNLKHGPDVDQPYEFREGRNFQTHSEENGFFEAVVGSRVASTMNIKVGDTFNPTHGDPDGKGHDLGFKIVGVLKPTGTPNDRATFVNMEGFYLMEGHAKPSEHGDEEEEAEADAEEEVVIVETDSEEAAVPNTPLPLDQREVTAILLRPSQTMFAMMLQNVINEGLQAQAATPIGEISKLMEQFVDPIRYVLLLITAITCIVAGVGILVSIYNSMNDRRRDIAVMRALGARRGTVMWIILLESGMIAVLGGLLGWIAAHGAIALASGTIEDRTGVPVNFFSTTSAELYVLPLVLGLAAIAGFVPALVAYRTDVSRALAS
ncbi:ABC transporter permease [Rosistilla oblonga]|uniref:ABC transporter permease n=1 Tax=Rosistilla oblonga TaxID=2527990 RepID=UPI003A981AAC